MPEVKITGDWWKWGDAPKRKSLLDYPRFKNHLEKLWDIELNPKFAGYKSFNVITDEKRSESVIRIFQHSFPSLIISGDPSLRLKKSIGKSYPELLSAASGTPIEIPDAVLFPKTHEEVQQVLRIATENKILVCPFGGGTNVVGAFKIPGRTNQARIAMDLSAMNQLLSLDSENHTAVFQCGISGPALEEILNKRGFTLGHFPQSFEFSTLGGWLATRSSGQESSFYGRIEDMAISLKIALPAGTVVAGGFEADAEGINTRHLFYGSEGMFGVITEAKLRINPIPTGKKWSAFLFPDFQTGLKALQEMIQSGIAPTVIRYSDEQETYLHSLLSQDHSSAFSNMKSAFKKAILKYKNLTHPAVMMMRIDGETSDARKKLAEKMLRKYDSFPIGESVGMKWESRRYDLPYLLDDMIQRGILVDTVETVLPWSKINQVRLSVYQALRECIAFNKEKGILLAHVSHVYHSSASIYFTMITLQDNIDPYTQWRNIKTLAVNTIVNNGGAISHHHSIGTDLQSWYVQKMDSITKAMLKSIKDTVDPEHILNPGKLFDE